MKKQLLIGAMLMGAFFTANAQTTISFEESEGYELGTLIVDEETGEGQEGWLTSDPNFVISDEQASEGDFSLFAESSDSQPDNLMVALKPMSFTESTFEVSQDVYTDLIDSENGSNFIIDIWSYSEEDETNYINSRIIFDYSGVIAIANGVNGQGQLTFAEGPEFAAETWYNVRSVVDTEAETITVYVDDEEVATAPFLSPGLDMTAIAYQFDDWASSFFVDNVNVVGGTAGTNDVISSKFSVFPNPTSDVINIANAENILVNGVTITDINGRTVKSAQFAGVANATVNVSDLASGVYMMTVTSDKGTAVKKIVKN